MDGLNENEAADHMDQITTMALNDTSEYYRKWAETYEQDHATLNNIIPQLTCQRLVEIYKEKRDIRILDCGAGTGLIGKELFHHAFKHLDALDGSQEMLKEAKKKNVYQRIICDFLGTNRLPIEDDTYDCLIAVGVICPGHANEECIPELIRIVKPGGIIYISTRDVNLTNPHLREHLEATMKHHHDSGNWKWLKKEIVPSYVGKWGGYIALFQVL